MKYSCYYYATTKSVKPITKKNAKKKVDVLVFTTIHDPISPLHNSITTAAELIKERTHDTQDKEQSQAVGSCS